jgi:urea transport system substrate-binding protein
MRHHLIRRRGQRKPATLLVVGTILSLVLAACAGGAEDDQTAGGTDGQATGETDAGAGEIVVGAILDRTGPINIYGIPKTDATNLAIKHINENGGVLGRQLRLVLRDAQSTNENYTQFANELAVQDQVKVVMGGITSASREAIRPVVNRHTLLYFYNEQYEGGVCDKNVFLTGVVPSQQLQALIPWTIENVGPKLYVLAADYNYGQISALWVDRIARENGGEVLGTEFIPLEVTEFGSAISKVQSAGPDAVVSLLVGGNHINFYREFAAAGLNEQIRIVSPTFGLGNEQVVLSPEESANITVAFPYFQELDNPQNEEFVRLWHEEYGEDYEYIPDAAVDEWIGWHLWAAAVEQAGTTERDAVIEALESGTQFEGPGGLVTMDPGSHHLVKDTHIGVANDQNGFDVIESFEQVDPSFEQEKCDLIADPTIEEQFIPEQE